MVATATYVTVHILITSVTEATDIPVVIAVTIVSKVTSIHGLQR